LSNPVDQVDLSGLRPRAIETLLADAEFQLLVYEMFNNYSAAQALMQALDDQITTTIDSYRQELESAMPARDGN